MAVDVIMPQMGESIFEGTITKWLKKPGDKIERDEPLFEISTDKVDAEIPSPSAGVLKEIKVSEGQTVPIQTVVALIDAAGAPSQPAAAVPSSAKTSSAASTSARPESAPTAKLAASKPTPVSATAAPSAPAKAPAPPAAPAPSAAQTSRHNGGDKIRSSPLVRRIARENHIDLTEIPGTGAGGRVSKRDILAAADRGATSTAAPPPAPSGAQPRPALELGVPRERIYFGHYEVQVMSNMRQKIAEHMVLSKRVSPHVYSVEEADVTGIAKLRADAKDKFEKESGTKLTFMPFFIRAAVEALRAFPTVNSSVDGTNIVLHKECNIGIAVALDWGLIVPVIKNAEEKNFFGLARAVTDLAERARSKKLKPEEVTESTFSITNPGVFGGLFGLPVINQPNVAILGLGTIEKRPVVIDDAIAIRSMVYLTLSYDHRAVDGAIAHQFMGHVKHTLQDWTESIF
jgi:2-oxoglutarate dehydrogenase E2 component (dihydrolipoamide succinyltransferase)